MFGRGCLLLIFAFFGGGALQGAHTPPAGFIFSVEAAADRDLVFELYFDGGTGWAADAVVRQSLRGDEQFHRLEFALPALPLRQLRLDPGYGGAKVRLRAPSLALAGRGPLKTWTADVLKPGQQIASFAVKDGVAVLTHSADAVDPMLFVEVPLHALTAPVVPATGWSRRFAPVLAAALLGTLVWIFVSAFRAIGPGKSSPRFARWASVGVLLLVFGLRVAWVDRFGTPVPYYDEWDSEGRVGLLAWHEERLNWTTLATPHNEHRLVLSRLLAIGGTALTGEWDPRVGMILGCALVAALALLITAIAVHALGRVGLIPALAVGVSLAAPTDSTNLLWGGQVQMYLFLALSLAVLALASFPSHSRSARIALVVGALLLLGTMGSGVLAAVAASGLVLFTRGHEARDASSRAAFVSFAALIGVVLIGWYWRAVAPHHAALRATSFAEWSEVFLRVRAWPSSHGYGAFLWWLPFFILLVLTLRRRLVASPLGWFALGCAGWTLTQCAALALARAGGEAPEPRHYTLLLMTPLSAAFSLLALAEFARLKERENWMRCLMLSATLALVITAIPLARSGVAAMRETKLERLEQQRMLVEFFTTNDATRLDPAGRAVPPYISGPSLAALLSDPAWRELLPPSLLTEKGRSTGDASASAAARAFLFVARAGVMIAALGAVLCLFAWFRRNASGATGVSDSAAGSAPAASR